MTVLDGVRIALRALRANLLRSVLTTLGILIGIASVIVMVAVGSGARSEIDKQIASLGSNMLVVFPGSGRSFGGRASGAGTDLALSEGDLAAIRREVPGVTHISGLLSGSMPVVRGNENWMTSVAGVHADYLTVRDWRLKSGRGLAEEDIRRGAKIALLGETVAKQLFPGEDPVGAQIRIKNVPVTIVGTLSRKGLSSFGRDQDDIVLVPITAARAQVIGKDEVVPDQVGQIYVKLEAGADLSVAEEDMGRTLRERRRIRPGAEDDFNVRNLAEFMATRTAAQQTLSWLLGATSAISLVVGGIGIMNIMLVSVTERTREIGLRIALGARRRDILSQFLVEAVMLCLLGGLLGIAIGIGLSHVIARAAEWPVLVEPQLVALAIGTAALIGIVFGFFPARRAARMNPIDALRSE
jgi:putative ABC transport system permease protein